jgi:ATP-dependent DNA helicase DinG
LPPWQAQTVWVSSDASGALHMAAYPKLRPAQARFLLTNDALQLADLLEASAEAATWSVIDLAELHRLLHPESASENLADLLPDAAADAPPETRLWQLWLQCEADLGALPLWTLEMVAAACQEFDDPATGKLFRLFADQAERQKNAARNWTATFLPTVKRVERPELPDLTDCTAVDAGAAVALLDEGGALARCVSGYEPRPGQLMMVRAVVEAINAGKHLVVEAGTGVGKSLGYLLPAALWARLNDVPVVISTNTRNLQTQLIEKDLPAVQRMLADSTPAAADGQPPRPLRTALIKGRSNYLCLRRLANQMEQAQFDLQRRELRQFASVLCWAARTPDGDLDTLASGAGVDQGIAAQLNSHADDCSGHACRLYRRCFIQKAREKALRADLIIANHSLVFTELSATSPIALPKHAQIIFDEAHNLEEAATRHFSIEWSPSRLNTFTRRLVTGRGKRRRGMLENLRRRVNSGALQQNEAVFNPLMLLIDESMEGVDALRKTGTALCRKLHGLLATDEEPLRYRFAADPANLKAPPPAPTAVWQAIRAAQAEFQTVVEAQIARLQTMSDLVRQGSEDELNLLAEETSDIAGAMQSLGELLQDVTIVLSGQDEESVFWVQRARGPEPLAEAWAAPLKVGPRLAKHLYEARRSVIFCSATLSVGGRFTYIGERLGLDLIAADRFLTCIAPSPFDYVRQCTLLVPAYLPEPNAMDRSYVAELANLIRQVATRMEGRTLCLFTSYDMLRQCAHLIEPELQEHGIRLLVHGESGSRDLILRTFRKGERCVLLGTHSFWEGVDVVGDALSCVILARLPFASPNDPVVSARCEQIDNEGQSAFRSLSLPAAVLRLRQGFGRLIRHRSDHGLVIVADTRILTKNYGGTFRRSLPCPTLACDDSDGFMARVASCTEAINALSSSKRGDV